MSSGLLHAPQGGAQISITTEIPEILIPGADTPIETQASTLGTYTYIIDDDGNYSTAKEIWDRYVDYPGTGYYLSYLKTNDLGHQAIFAYGAHNGLNLKPTEITWNGDNPPEGIIPPYVVNPDVAAVLIERPMNFGSKRIIITVNMHEQDYTNTELFLLFIPYNENESLQQRIAKIYNYYDAGTVSNMSIFSGVHNGAITPINQDIIPLKLVEELPSAGRYYVGLMAVSSQPTNAYPTIYGLNFHTY